MYLRFSLYFLLCTVRCIFFGTNVISTLSGLTYKNIEKMANKIFNVPKHLKEGISTFLDDIITHTNVPRW